MSSSSTSNLLVIRAENSTNLYFLRQLPFYPQHSTAFTYPSFSNAFGSIPTSLQLSNNLSLHRGQLSPSTVSPDTPGNSSSISSEATLSPDLPPLVPSDPFEWLFIDSFNNLAIHQQGRTSIQARLDSLTLLLENISGDLIEERESAVRAIELLTADALRTVRRRLIPEIERVERLLNRND